MSSNPMVSGNVDWRVSSQCESGACVGVARYGEFIIIGNSSDPEAPVSKFTKQEWSAFVVGVKLGEFDDFS